jgi:hypothetical protein
MHGGRNMMNKSPCIHQALCEKILFPIMEKEDQNCNICEYYKPDNIDDCLGKLAALVNCKLLNKLRGKIMYKDMKEFTTTLFILFWETLFWFSVFLGLAWGVYKFAGCMGVGI